MKSAPLLVFALVASWGWASAQQAPLSQSSAGTESSPGPANQPPSTVVIAPAQTCPVSMLAKQAGMTGLIRAQKGPDAQPETPETLSKPAQRIHLIVNGVSGDRKIKGATITARGLSARGRFAKASPGTGASDIRRTIDVSFTAEQSGTLVAEIALPGFTSVKSIKLEALRYADGTTRDIAQVNLCTVAPDPVMLAGR